MKFDPNSAPTEFLKSYGIFLEAFQRKDKEAAEKKLEDLKKVDVSGMERILLVLADELMGEQASFEEVLNEYLEQVIPTTQSDALFKS